MRGEFDFIKSIRDQAAIYKNPDLILGIGDDAAVLRECEGRESLVTVDLLVEDIDFRLEYAVPQWLGHKVLAVSLSDIAAMGGDAKFSLLTLGIPPSLISDSRSFWEEFFNGYFALAEKHGVGLIGGDISSTPDRLLIDSVVIGHCAAGRHLRRSGARAGDQVYVTGALGASAVGLRFLLRGTKVSEQDATLIQSALRAHLRPEPRVEFGRLVGEAGMATSMIDVSDGLLQDLEHICEESRVASIIDFDATPIAYEVGLVTEDADDAFSLAVNGGEDFELLLTARCDNETRLYDLALACGLRLTHVGEIIECDGSPPIRMQRQGDIKALSIHGYNHFAV